MVNENTRFYREALKGASEVAESGTTEDVDELLLKLIDTYEK